MKTGTIAFLLIISYAMASAKPTIMEYQVTSRNVKTVNGVDINLCPLCVQFAGEFINALLNIILNTGVVGGCGELCSLLPTSSKVAIEACNILCDLVGIKEFIALIEKADLDPIYYCELLKTCPIKDDGDAKITSLVVTPQVGAQGTQFTVDMSYTTRNGTGTGEIVLQIDTVDGVPLGNSNLQAPQDPGSYTGGWKVDASPDPNCDPSQGPCEQWLAGNYTVIVAICNGECGSKHPHSQIYDQSQAMFQITNSNRHY